MEINKIPIHSVIHCKEEDSVKEIANKLREKKDRRIFVLGHDEKLIGLITTTDLVYKALGENGDLKAKDVMTKHVLAVDIGEDFDKALEIMDKTNSFVCPVTEHGKILGIIDYHDLVNYVFKSIEK